MMQLPNLASLTSLLYRFEKYHQRRLRRALDEREKCYDTILETFARHDIARSLTTIDATYTQALMDGNLDKLITLHERMEDISSMRSHIRDYLPSPGAYRLRPIYRATDILRIGLLWSLCLALLISTQWPLIVIILSAIISLPALLYGLLRWRYRYLSPTNRTTPIYYLTQQTYTELSEQLRRIAEKRHTMEHIVYAITHVLPDKPSILKHYQTEKHVLPEAEREEQNRLYRRQMRQLWIEHRTTYPLHLEN